MKISHFVVGFLNFISKLRPKNGIKILITKNVGIHSVHRVFYHLWNENEFGIGMSSLIKIKVIVSHMKVDLALFCVVSDHTGRAVFSIQYHVTSEK